MPTGTGLEQSASLLATHINSPSVEYLSLQSAIKPFQDHSLFSAFSLVCLLSVLDTSEDEIPAAWRVIVPLVVLQMELARAEKKAERRKLRESERAIESNGCEKRLLHLLKSMGDEARATKRRKCTLQYFQSTIADLERTLLGVKGLNTVHAGRKCQ